MSEFAKKEKKKKSKKSKKSKIKSEEYTLEENENVNTKTEVEKSKKKKTKKSKKDKNQKAFEGEKKKKSKKKRKKEAEESEPVKKKKKKKRVDCENEENVQPDQEEKQKKKKKTKKEKGKAQANEKVQGVAESEVMSWRESNGVKVFGEDGKVYRPLQTFAQTCFPKDVLAITSTFEKPTLVQSQCWPPLLEGRDVIGIARTGSGKTLAFTLPVLVKLRNTSPKGGPFSLMISPTRELVMQIEEVCEKAGSSCGVKTAVIYGGMPKRDQINSLKGGVHIIVATPGRLLGLIEEGYINLAKVSYLVLDEADRMLDQGFIPDVRRIVSGIKTKRQTLLFSATWPEEVQAVAKEFVTDPVRVAVGSGQSNHDVTQTVEVVERWERDEIVHNYLTKYHKSKGCKNRVLIFGLYKAEIPKLEMFLKKRGWKCASIHGNKNQYERIEALKDFKSNSCPLLIATDVAARGLDIPDVEYVLNYSFPLTIEDYIHRIGRTGRAGKKGFSHTFFQKSDKHLSGELINTLREAKAEVPDNLLAFGTGVKRKKHALFGLDYRRDDGRPMPKAQKVKL